ncbi:MAG: hypothetical protein RI575_08170 [Balneolaceae bacterium]|nr:hypothetical protein [Balneolaceae bacterium]
MRSFRVFPPAGGSICLGRLRRACPPLVYTIPLSIPTGIPDSDFPHRDTFGAVGDVAEGSLENRW